MLDATNLDSNKSWIYKNNNASEYRQFSLRCQLLFNQSSNMIGLYSSTLLYSSFDTPGVTR